MKVEITRIPRKMPIPLWAVFVVLTWLCLGAAALFLSIYFNHPANLCMFKNITGFSCPACGFTRGALRILHGHFIQGWLYNPLLFSALGLLLVISAVRLAFARSIRIRLSKPERLYAWAIMIVLFLSNWAYVIFRDWRD